MSLFDELKRRNVFRVGTAYLVAAWLLLQVADIVLENIGAPAWVMKGVMLLLAIGLPVALILAWAFELTPEGVKRESEVDRTQSITPRTGQRLNRIIIAMLAIALAYFIVESRFLDRDGEPENDMVSELEKSIAVLPFSNLSNDPENDMFVSGLHDDLLTQLSKIRELNVIARTSVLGYANTTRKVSDIGRELGVATVLEGGVQRAGDRVRINVQLIATDNDQHLWAETYDRELSLDNIFDIQSEITRQIVSQLQAAMTAGEAAKLETHPTDNLAAYEAYLDARYFLDRWGTNNFDMYAQSLAAAERAVELDPEFADAWAVLGWVQLYQFWYAGRDRKMAQVADRATARALELDPDSAFARSTRGWYHYWVFFDYDASIPQFKRAIELQPGMANAWDGLASAYRRSGRWRQAVEAFDRSRKLSPNFDYSFVELAETYRTLRDFAASDRVTELATRRFPDSYPVERLEADLHLSRTGERQPLLVAQRRAAGTPSVSGSTKLDYVLTEGIYGDLGRALAYLQEWSPGTADVQYDYWPEELIVATLNALSDSGDASIVAQQAQYALENIERELAAEPDNAELEKARGLALALLGRRDAAVASARRTRELYPLTLDAFGGLEYLEDAIRIAAMAGDTNLALEWLDEYQGGGVGQTLMAFSTDKTLTDIVNTEGFAELVDRYGLVPEDRNKP
jgi:TolB-like protein